jgi:hypothetical protein
LQYSIIVSYIYFQYSSRDFLQYPKHRILAIFKHSLLYLLSILKQRLLAISLA